MCSSGWSLYLLMESTVCYLISQLHAVVTLDVCYVTALVIIVSDLSLLDYKLKAHVYVCQQIIG